MAVLRSLLCASLLAAAHAAVETCSDPLAASALPTPVVDAEALSAQACGYVLRALGARREAHARAVAPQIMKLSLISEAESPAVTRIVYTKQDMEARECVGGRCASRFRAALTQTCAACPPQIREEPDARRGARGSVLAPTRDPTAAPLPLPRRRR